ncbi:MAG: choice-of-anchor D domain-containing protein [Candidatus Zhuqueibacterota bacterium]
MKAYTWQRVLSLVIAIHFLGLSFAHADITSKHSNIFTLDTRVQNPDPVDGWQIVTNQGNTYNEDIIIDDVGKVWCFYLRNIGPNPPVYMKIFTSTGYIYKHETVVGHASPFTYFVQNSIRAALNSETGDVWVALEGNSGGYFVRYDSTGEVVQDSTLLAEESHLPKIIEGTDGQMWFSWHTFANGGAESFGKIAAYSNSGALAIRPIFVSQFNNVFNTDIAMDDSNQIWVVLDSNDNGNFASRYCVFNEDLDLIIAGNVISNNPIPLNPQRQILADRINGRVWILAKNDTTQKQKLNMYGLDGSLLTSINNVGECAFLRNETNHLEVMRFNSSDPLNKLYQIAMFNAQDGSLFQDWTTEFDSTYSFVRNGLSYEGAQNGLKIYAVHEEENLTRIKFLEVTAGLPEITISPSSVNFDTTKIINGYIKHKDIKVSNIGNATLAITDINNERSNFFVSDTVLQLSPGQSDNITVYFDPADTNVLYDTLIVHSNSVQNNPFEVALAGRGYNPGFPDILVNPTTLDFDSLVVRNSLIRYLYVYNQDVYEHLVISSVTSQSPHFSHSTDGFTLGPKRGEYIAVTFRPTYAGTHLDTLYISSNDPENPNLAVPLFGVGLSGEEPQIVVDVDSLYFGELALGRDKVLYVGIENEGQTTLTVSEIASSDSQFTAEPAEFSLSPYSKRYIAVNFHAYRLGEALATLTIQSDDLEFPEYNIKLVGIGREEYPPSISVYSDSIDFGIVPVGNQSLKYFWVINEGEQTLDVESLVSSDKQFITDRSSFSLTPGGVQMVAVTFVPDEPGLINAELILSSNDPENSRKSVTLVGQGRNLTEPNLVVNAQQLDFGAVGISHSTTKYFTVYNSGEQTLSVTNIYISGVQGNPYNVHPGSFNLSPYQYQTIYVTFTPNVLGQLNGTLNIESNDPPTRTVSLVGTGRLLNDPNLYVDKSLVSFSETAITRTTNSYLWFSNTGEQELIVETMTHSDTSFSVNIDNFSLNPGQSQYVVVSFAPKQVGEYLDTLKVYSNDPEDRLKNIVLLGSGRNLYSQNIQISNDSLAFGAVPINQRITYGLVVYNTGEQDLTISNIGNALPEFLVDTRQFTVSSNSYRTLYITFEPDSLKDYNDELSISSNDPETPVSTVKLSGIGRNLLDQNLATAPDSLFFGSIGVGLNHTMSIQLRNIGEKNLVIDSIRVTHPMFSLSGQSALTLSPGASQWLNITFTPTAVDTFDAELHLYSDDVDSSDFIVPLLGYGRELTGPNLVVSPDELNFQDVPVRGIEEVFLSVYNSGEQHLNITDIQSGDVQFVPAPTELTLSPGASQLVKVTFSPMAIDTFETELIFFSNDGDSSEFEVPMTGIGRDLREQNYVSNVKSVEFGEVMLGQRITRSITFSNSGDLPLVLYNCTTTDTHFVCATDSFIVIGGSEYALQITFTPSDTHFVQADLIFNTNDPDVYSTTIPLRGSGQMDTQQIAVSPGALSFGDVRIHTTRSRSIQVSNFGEKTLNVFNIIPTDTVYSTSIGSFSLIPNETRTVFVYFTPDTIRSYQAQLLFVSDDPVTDTLAVILYGVGRDSLSAAITTSTDSLGFGEVAVDFSRSIHMTLYNSGEKTLQISNITTTDSVFSVGLTNFNVNPNSQALLLVTFTPESITSYADTLTIFSNDPNNDTLLIELTGIGRKQNDQHIAVSDTSLNFGVVPTDRSSTKTFWVYNNGEKTLDVTQIAVSDSQYTVNKEWLLIAPGQYEYLQVTFSPDLEDTIKAVLTLTSNDPDESDKTIQLSGIGELYTGPRIIALNNSLNFGNMLIGATKKMTFRVKNLSLTDTLIINNLTSNNSNFTVSKSEIKAPPMDSTSIQVTYKPNSIGYHSAALTLYSNDLYQEQFNFWVYGQGISENVGTNYLANLGWKVNGYSPFGQYFSPNPYTDDVLSGSDILNDPNGRADRAWFVKDVFIYDNPDTAILNICYDDQIFLYVNGTYVYNDTSATPLHWNIADLNVKPYLKLGRNRIAISVWNEYKIGDFFYGGFDCEFVVDGEAKIRRGDQNWTHPDATWWYFGENGDFETKPVDTINNRLWFYGEYGLSEIDSVTANWSFEPIVGDTLYDDTPYGQVAILHNIAWIQGISGSSMRFSGAYDSYVELRTNLNTVPQSIELWFNCYGLRSGYQNIITNKGSGSFGHGLFINETGLLGVYYYDGEFLTDYLVQLNTWLFVSTQYSNDRIRVYINNTLVGEYDITEDEAGNPTGGNYCYLGGNPLGADTTAFNGAIDELVIKNSAFAPSPMQAVATISVSEPDSVVKLKELQLSFNVFPSPFKLISGTLEYAKGGSQNYHSVTVPASDSLVSPVIVSIPADSMTIRGLKYRIYLTTNYGSVYFPQTGEGEEYFSWINVRTSGENSTVTIPEKIYKMVSVPYEADSQSVFSVLADDLKEYNPYFWRLFEWDHEDTQYVEFGDTLWQSGRGFERGKSYWLISTRALSFDAGSGHSPSETHYRIQLTPGWNMISNPFPYSVSWLSVLKSSEGIADPVYWAADDTIRWIYNVEELAPWAGYFLWNGDASTRSILIPPLESSEVPLKKPLSLADRYEEKYGQISVLIAAEARCGRFVDIDNLFGIAENANNELDSYDMKEAPAIGNFVSLFIDNKSWSEQGGAYTVDIRKQDGAGQCWPVTLLYTLESPPNNMSLSLKPITALPEDWSMYLFDLSNDLAVNIGEEKSLAFKPVAKQPTKKNYKLIVGTREFIESNSDGIPLVPLKFELFQNYPNPFNAATTISFNLPERMKATVKIYNVLGQLVKTVVDDAEMRGGHQTLIWDGKNEHGNLVTTGLYLVRLETKKDIAIKKLLLIK